MGGKLNKAKRTVDDDDKVGPVSRTKIVFLLLLILALPLIWRWTPLDGWINLHTILEWQRSLRDDPAAIFYVIAVYLVGSLVFFPITILTLATVFAFGPVWGNVYALFGWLLSASEGYFLGHLIGQEVLHAVAGERLGRVPGILTLALFGVQLENALRQPGLASFALLLIILVAVPIIVSRMFRRFYDRQTD